MDGKTILDDEDDVASVKLGAPWRMPTEAEFKELIERCAWKWTKWYGMQGYKVVGPNGKHIFFPAAGANFYKNKLKNSGRDNFAGAGKGSYWTCDRSYSEIGGRNMSIDEEHGPKMVGSVRCSGCTVRPVFK